MENWNDSPEELIEKIIEAIYDFTGDSPQSDDITLVIVKRMNQ